MQFFVEKNNNKEIYLITIKKNIKKSRMSLSTFTKTQIACTQITYMWRKKTETTKSRLENLQSLIEVLRKD